jgi:hypothetical protein
MDERYDLEVLIEKHKDKPGIDVNKLKPGTKIRVETVYSVYEFKVSHTPGYVYAQGGKHLPYKQLVHFNGCTFGGSAIRPGWIGQDLHMEIMVSKKRKLTTSAVQKASVQGDGWAYDLWD